MLGMRWQVRAFRILALVVVVSAGVVVAAAGGAFDHVARTVGAGDSRPADEIAHIVRLIASAPVKSGRTPLAASVGEAGHWRLVNRAREPFTAAGPEELLKGFQVLAAEADGRADRIQLHLTADTFFKHRAAVSDLPGGVALSVHVGGRTYAVERVPTASVSRP